jgi:hypothetical protein
MEWSDEMDQQKLTLFLDYRLFSNFLVNICNSDPSHITVFIFFDFEGLIFLRHKKAQMELEEETGIKEYHLLHDGLFAFNILPVPAHYKNGQYNDTP